MATSTVPVEGTLEKIFQKLEQESERRAQDEDRVAAKEPPVASGSKDHSTLEESVGLKTRPKDRRRGSVSVSVFGQLSESSTDTTSNTSFAMSPLASAASKSPFYHSLVNAKSVDTLISDHSVDDGNQTEDDQHHVTRIQTIAGRSNSVSKTIDKVGALLSQNSTQRKRARRSTALSLPAVNADVVIGVRVERATVETDSGENSKSGYATVYAEGSKRALRRASWFSMPGTNGLGSIAMKAKNFTQKFKQRSKPELSNSEIAA